MFVSSGTFSLLEVDTHRKPAYMSAAGCGGEALPYSSAFHLHVLPVAFSEHDLAWVDVRPPSCPVPWRDLSESQVQPSIPGLFQFSDSGQIDDFPVFILDLSLPVLLVGLPFKE